MKLFWRIFFLVLLCLSSVFSATPYVDKIEKSASEKEAVLFVSWNVKNFGRSKTPEVIARMAKFLRNADIVALQEVSTSQFGAQTVASLSDELNRTGAKWDYAVSDATHPSKSKECYAFLWKSSKIKTSSRIKLLVSEFASGMEREPGLVEFSIDDRPLSVATLHLVPTAKDPKAETVFLSSKAQVFSAQCFILAGDFNLGYKMIGKEFEEKMNMKHQIEGKTSLKNKFGAKGEYLLNEYDNIYSRGVSVVRAGILDFFPVFGGFTEAKEISDHLPVFIVFKL